MLSFDLSTAILVLSKREVVLILIVSARLLIVLPNDSISLICLLAVFTIFCNAKCSLLISLCLSIVSDNDFVVAFITSITVSDFEGVSFIWVSVVILTVSVVGAVFFLENNIIYLQ